VLQEIAVKNEDFLFGDGPEAALQLMFVKCLWIRGFFLNIRLISNVIKECMCSCQAMNSREQVLLKYQISNSGGDLLVLRINRGTHTGC
jgi:hypothetical protein